MAARRRGLRGPVTTRRPSSAPSGSTCRCSSGFADSVDGQGRVVADEARVGARALEEKLLCFIVYYTMKLRIQDRSTHQFGEARQTHGMHFSLSAAEEPGGPRRTTRGRRES